MRSVFVALVLAAALGAAGCGSSDATTPAANTPPPQDSGADAGAKKGGRIPAPLK